MLGPRSHRRAATAAALMSVLAILAGCGSAYHVRDDVRSVAGGQAAGDSERYVSVPDVRPARIEVTAPADDTAPGLLFAAPRPGAQSVGGPMIFDDSGQLVWFKPLPRNLQAIDFRAQTYRGKPVLTYGVRPVDAHAGAYTVIADSSYNEIARVHAGDGDGTDLHDFVITPHDTALLIGYHVVGANLSGVGGRTDGQLLDGTIQEVDIPTGRVLWRWSALAHIPLSESTANVPATTPWDAYHLNSVDEDADGNLLVSARHTSTVYKIDRATGNIDWRLGGKSSDFTFGPHARFHFQHDAELHDDGTVTVFDNGSTNNSKVEDQSRGLRLRLDMAKHTATVARTFTDPDPIEADSQGSFQTLPDGHALIGWGKQPVLTEFAADGELLLQARFADDGQQSYSARRFAWTGTPTQKPAVVATRSGRRVTLHASFNGATTARTWEVLAGDSLDSLTQIGAARWAGFETVLRVRTTRRYVEVRALDSGGHVLATSAPITPR